ncbi:hypothetical protein, partial [Staphylococcus aureus]|uniref:hypothetical protein n=1 Tax=Staphylococcus aureus TaxID=1280 RepID=UPI000681F665
GHNTGTGGKSAYNNMQVGEAQHSEIGFLISTDDASWGNGHNTGTGGKSAYNNMQVGGATT